MASPINGIDDIQYIPFTYNNADSETSALHLILYLRPEWEESEGKIEFVRFTDGITNTLLKAIKKRPGASDEDIDREAILLRAYGSGTDILIDRKKEAATHTLLASLNLAPQLLARFQNGLLYKFIRGRPCSPEDLRREPVWRAVARRLGQWHAMISVDAVTSCSSNQTNADRSVDKSFSLPGLRRQQQQVPEEVVNAITPGKAVPNIWTVMQKWIYALPDHTEKQIARKLLLQKELERNVKQLASRPRLGKDGLVVGHCDLLSGNIIILPRSSKSNDPKQESKEVSFIDYEYATPSPAAFDIANHFAEWGGFDCDFSVLPTRSQRRKFLKEYLESYNGHLQGQNGQGQVSHELDEQVQELFEEVDLFRGMPGFYWGIWSLIQAQISKIDFDYAAYAEVRLGEYWAWRGESDGADKEASVPLRERRWAEE